MEGDLSDGEIPDEQIQPPSRDDLPDADPALVRRGPASSYPPTASDRVQKPVDATIGVSSGVRAGGGYGSVRDSVRGVDIGYKRGRMVDATPSGEILVRLDDGERSAGNRGQFRNYGDSGREFRVESGGRGGVRRSLGHELGVELIQRRNAELEKVRAEIDDLE